jgi:hypothetical protein
MSRTSLCLLLGQCDGRALGLANAGLWYEEMMSCLRIHRPVIQTPVHLDLPFLSLNPVLSARALWIGDSRAGD